MKKLLIVLLCAVMVLGMNLGCEKKDPSVSDTVKDVEDAAKDTADDMKDAADDAADEVKDAADDMTD